MLSATRNPVWSNKVDCLSDYERRELDYWIAENIEQLCVRHSLEGIEIDSQIRLSDRAYREFKQRHPDWKPTATGGPYPVCMYSFNPVIALNVFQTTEYSENWIFMRQDEAWHGANDGLHVRHCKSFALCLMLALQHEYNFQNNKENSNE